MPGTEIHVPHEIVNDDVVTIACWHVETGGKVVVGQPVVSIETSKSVFDITAETEGYLEILTGDLVEVAVGSLLARIHAAPVADGGQRPTVSATAWAVSSERPLGRPSSGPGSLGGTMQTRPGDSVDAGCRFSAKAQRLVDREHLDPSVFAGKGLVRESDVMEYLQRAKDKVGGEGPLAEARPGCTPQAAGAAADGAAAEGAGLEPVPVEPTVPESAARRGTGLWHDVRTSARDRGRGAVWLVLNYFWKSWLLRNLVRWAPYGVPQYIHRLRGVKMGSGCFIDPTAIVETAYGENITIGNDVRVSAGAVIMTHIKAPHFLRERGLVPLVKKAVVLEDHCFIGVNAIIMPGVTVGKASVVASGAVVLGDVPPFCMVAGNPAKVVKTLTARRRAAGERSGDPT